MTPCDTQHRAEILQIVFGLSLRWLDELESAPRPMPYGMAQRWRSMLISPDVIDRLYGDSCPWAWGYAATMEAISKLYESIPKMQFVHKNKQA